MNTYDRTLNMLLIFSSLCIFSKDAHALSYEECLSNSVQSAAADMTVQEIKKHCKKEQKILEAQNVNMDNNSAGEREETVKDETTKVQATPLESRFALERFSRNNPYTLTPYRPNYAVASYTTDPNNEPYQIIDAFQEQPLDNEELEFQLSLRFMLVENMLNDRAHLSINFTTHAIWQAFNSEHSSPFRETNYEPEMMFTYLSGIEIFGLKNVANSVIFNHQSNGQSQELSRSWNRIKFSFLFERGNYAMGFTPWYRIPEDQKEPQPDFATLSAEGDDNPDISEYVGYFDWLHTYKYKNATISLNLRNNLRTDDNRNTIDLTYSTPVHGRLLLYVKYFNGWGRSMIDYDAHQQTFSVGFALNDWI